MYLQQRYTCNVKNILEKTRQFKKTKENARKFQQILENLKKIVLCTIYKQ